MCAWSAVPRGDAVAPERRRAADQPFGEADADGGEQPAAAVGGEVAIEQVAHAVAALDLDAGADAQRERRRDAPRRGAAGLLEQHATVHANTDGSVRPQTLLHPGAQVLRAEAQRCA